MKLFLAVVLAIIASTVAEDINSESNFRWSHDVTGRIINGTNATLGQFPYIVSCRGAMNNHVCGGFLISPTYVVTAAHCGRIVEVVAGVVGLYVYGDEAKYRQQIKVVQSIQHPNYSSVAILHDITLLKLASPVKLNAAVNLIRLPKAGSQPTGMGVLAGWGVTATNDTRLPNYLQTVTLPILTNKECTDAIKSLQDKNILRKNLNFVDKAMTCTGLLSGGLAGCSGDSGGPLAQNGTVHGIVSWSARPCAAIGSPTVYAKVENYLDFIKLNVPDLPAN